MQHTQAPHPIFSVHSFISHTYLDRYGLDQVVELFVVIDRDGFNALEQDFGTFDEAQAEADKLNDRFNPNPKP